MVENSYADILFNEIGLVHGNNIEEVFYFIINFLIKKAG
jgi:hypothetical protein